MANVGSGFFGLVQISGSTYTCSDVNVNLEQDILFYDHTYGLRDSIAITTLSGNIQKTFMRPGTQITRGSISILPTSADFFSLLKLAKYASVFEIKMNFGCSGSQTFSNCKVNSFAFSVGAGDIANISLDIIGDGTCNTSANTITSATSNKLLNWQDVSVTGSNSYIKSFELNVNNNCFPIYTASSGLTPYTINVGMQEVHGSYSSVNIDNTDVGGLGPSTTSASISLAVGSSAQTINGIFKPCTYNNNPSLPVKTYAFVGIDKPLGE